MRKRKSTLYTLYFSVIVQTRYVIGLIYERHILQIWKETEVTQFFGEFFNLWVDLHPWSRILPEMIINSGS